MTSRHTQHADLRGLNARHQSTPWPWIVMAIFWLLTLWAGMQHLDAEAAAEAQAIAQKNAAQKPPRQHATHATHVDRIAAEVCRSSHGPDAAHYWDTSGVLVCAATRAAIDSAVHAVAAVQQASRGQRP